MKVDRLISIIMILLDKERIGAKDLADMFEVSPRTIYRDIDAINLSGIPIRSTPGVGGGFEIMPQYKLDNKVFSTSDLSAILMGLSSLSDMMGGDELTNALAKVKSFIPAEKSKDIEIKASQINIDLSPWIGNRNIQPYFEKIKVAIQGNKLLSFEYVSRHGEQTTRLVEPYQLILKYSHWYLQAFCNDRNDYRLFKLSRMSSLTILNQDFSPREYEKPKLNFNEVLDTLQATIKIRIHKSVMDQVLDYCSFDNFTPDGNEHYIVSFPFIENDFYYGFLLSFGDKCQCLEPASIQSEMKLRIDAISKLYT